MTTFANNPDNTSINKNQQSGIGLASFTNWIFYLLKKWKLFTIVAIVGGIIGIIYAFTQKPKFESHLTFALDDGAGNEGLSGAMNLAAEFGLNIGGSGQSMFSGDNIEQIMTSRKMIENALLSIDTFDNEPYVLIEYYIDKSGLRKKLNSNPRLHDIHFFPNKGRGTFTYLQDSILYNVYQEFEKNLVTIDKTDKLLNIYEVKVLSPDEKFTKVFTDKLVNETNTYYVEICSKKSKETLDILEQRADAMKGKLGNSINSKAITQDANINPAFATAQTPILKQEFNVRAYGEAYGEIFKNLELARFQYLKKIPLMQIVDDANYPMKKIKLNKLIMGIDFALFSVLLLLFFFWVRRILGLIKVRLQS